MFVFFVISLVSPANVNINVKTTETWYGVSGWILLYGVSGWILLFQSFYCLPKSELLNVCTEATFMTYLWDHVFIKRARVDNYA